MKKNLIAFTAAALCALSGTAGAVSTEAAGISIRLDNKLSAGASWRLEERDDKFVGIGNGGEANSTNGDDGNLAFDKGDIVAGAFKVTSDLTAEKGGFGIFVRGSYVFNERLYNYGFFNEDNYYTPPAAGPDIGVGLRPNGCPTLNLPQCPSEVPISVLRERRSDVQDKIGNDADLLDAYVFGAFDAGNRQFAFKIGRQVINWGESTFVLHGINSLLTFNQNKQRVPGFEIEELLRPAAMAWFSAGIVEGVSAEVFYQLDWEKTEVDAAGTYLATNDFAGIGGRRANITFGLPYADDSAIVAAAELAGMTGFINRHPRGFDMPVGERGESLSGGQRQGIGLARAVLHNAPILLLDEPTSAMDFSTEAQITQQITKFAEGKTVVLVTHRTSLLSMVNRVIVIDGGKIVADGPRDRIMEALSTGRIARAA